MKNTDHLPLDNTPVTARITEHHNNRLGAVYSALHSFWSARNAGFRGLEARLDSYTVLLFDRNVLPIIVDDYTSSPEEMLEAVLAHGTGLGTKYTNALNAVQLHMESHWNVDKFVLPPACYDTSSLLIHGLEHLSSSFSPTVRAAIQIIL